MDCLYGSCKLWGVIPAHWMWVQWSQTSHWGAWRDLAIGRLQLVHGKRIGPRWSSTSPACSSKRHIEYLHTHIISNAYCHSWFSTILSVLCILQKKWASHQYYLDNVKYLLLFMYRAEFYKHLCDVPSVAEYMDICLKHHSYLKF